MITGKCLCGKVRSVGHRRKCVAAVELGRQLGAARAHPGNVEPLAGRCEVYRLFKNHFRASFIASNSGQPSACAARGFVRTNSSVIRCSLISSKRSPARSAAITNAEMV